MEFEDIVIVIVKIGELLCRSNSKLSPAVISAFLTIQSLLFSSIM